MQNIVLINRYNIKSLCLDNHEIVEKLCEKCFDFYILHDGILPSIKDIDDIFVILPPNKNYKDKFVLRIFKYDNELVGLVDIVRDFPTVGEWMLGLMLIKPQERSYGLGKIVHDSLVRWAINL
ncbi:GNAT family N-acetyltransferase [Clostridium estertheticum]|uniref:GNAT family N-acetyltransferase n=1 Tax=Clostridium estertheticum TaxID=238834 RepID=UPI001CF1A621|nr:GNAT family N-acetyltransferase [Clostridium estertheticum]MCB2358989.1 GNAT family N-acetyltransferase [Clostridium estertheticum]